MSTDYDVVIAGGGPAGATVAAILGRHTNLKVGLYEQEFFPREHIGESLIFSLVPVLSYSGALPKVLASDCYHGPKVGGIFAWDPGKEDPWCFMFNDQMYDELGIFNFAMHVNRSEFDQILLEHARDVGVDVHEGMAVSGIERSAGQTIVRLDDGSEVSCKIFVEASGRITSITGTRKQFLSDYKNIAIWNHFIGGKPAENLPGDWNLFHERQLKIPGFKGEQWSPIISTAFDDGWFWYIPVPKVVMGKRVLTHSVGLVTDPKILGTSRDKQYTDMQVFLAKIKEIPLLSDLTSEAVAISDKVLTATNYSMISDRICNYDEHWIMVGDAAFFVDPLFSTGVGLSINGATSVAFMIQATLDDSIPEQHKRDLWYDYQQRARTLALTLSIGVDQWYHGIARKNPDSIYWKSRRGEIPPVDLRYQTFRFLVNGETTNLAEFDYTGDRQRWIRALTLTTPPPLLHFIKAFWRSRSPDEQVMTMKNPLDGLKASAPAVDSLILNQDNGEELSLDSNISMKPNVSVRKSLLLNQLQARKATTPEYWQDPLGQEKSLDSTPHYYDCERFYFEDKPDDVEVPFLEEFENGLNLYGLLKEGAHTYGDLKQVVAPEQRSLLGRLHNAGMLMVA